MTDGILADSIKYVLEVIVYVSYQYWIASPFNRVTETGLRDGVRDYCSQFFHSDCNDLHL